MAAAVDCHGCSNSLQSRIQGAAGYFFDFFYNFFMLSYRMKAKFGTAPRDCREQANAKFDGSYHFLLADMGNDDIVNGENGLSI